MLSESLAGTILTASIAGAGLVMTVYSLISPIAREIFEERIKIYEKKKAEFDELKKKIGEESSEKDFEHLKKLALEIKEIKMLPRYLSQWAPISFFSYILTAIFDIAWLGNPHSYSMLEVFIMPLFFIGTISFLVTGAAAIHDIRSTIKSEYEKMKKGKEEVSKITKTLSAGYAVRKEEDDEQ